MRRHAITLGLLALSGLLPAQYQSADTLFITQARQALVWDADQPGLEALMNATEALGPRLDDDDRRALTEAAREALGEPPTTRVAGLLGENSDVLAEADRAAAATPFDPYPMTSSYSASITSQGHLRVPAGRSDRFTPADLCNLLLADAQRAAAAGDEATATERITQALRINHSLTTHLRDPNLWGLQIHSLIESLRLAGELATDGDLGPENLQALRQEVEALDLDEATVGAIIGELVESRKRVIRQAEIDPGMRNRLRISLREMQAGPQMEEFELDLFRGSESFSEEIDHLVDVLDDPANEWGPAVRIYEGQPTFRQGLVHVAVLLNIARARAAIAEIMIALAEGEQPPSLEDPFSEGSIQVTETRVYSVGPDGVNDGGLLAHRLNQERRLFTEGDIISAR